MENDEKVLRYVKIKHTFIINRGFEHNKPLTSKTSTFEFEERKFLKIDSSQLYNWRNTKTYNWETFPENSPLASKKLIHRRKNGDYYKITFTDYVEDPYMHRVGVISQLDCPLATFQYEVTYYILSPREFKLSDLLENENAYYVMEFLRDNKIQIPVEMLTPKKINK